jgi:hypothetical protein
MHLLSSTLSSRRLGILIGLFLVLLTLTILLLAHTLAGGAHHYGPFFAPTAVEYALL